MTMLIEDPHIEEELIARRQAWGADHHDEVWEGVYFMSPLPNNEHQRIVNRFCYALTSAVEVPGLGMVLAGANLAGSADNWQRDYRDPDVVVLRNDTAAESHDEFLTGAADFIIEITGPRDRTYEKLDFYSRIGVRELLILNRQSWTLELYRHLDGGRQKVGDSATERPEFLTSEMLPLQFRLISGESRPQVEVRHNTTGEQWLV